MWEFHHKEGWAPKNWCFRTVVLEKILESPLDWEESQSVNPKGNQPWYSLEGLMLKLKLQYFGHLMWRADLLEKDSDAGKIEGMRRGQRDGWMASPTPGVSSNSHPWSQWCHPTISSSVIPFSSHLQSFPESGSFPVSQLFTSGGQSIGVSASASVLLMNIRTDLIYQSFQVSKSKVFIKFYLSLRFSLWTLGKINLY